MSNLLGYAAAIPGAIVGVLVSTFFGDIFSHLMSSLVDILSEWIFSFFPILRNETASIDAASDGGKMNLDICKEAKKEAIVDQVTLEAKRKRTKGMKGTILEVTKEAKEKIGEAMKDTILEVTEAKEKTDEAILKVTKKAKEKTARVTTLFPNASSLHDRAQKIHATPYLKRYAKSYCISDEPSSPDFSRHSEA